MGCQPSDHFLSSKAPNNGKTSSGRHPPYGCALEICSETNAILLEADPGPSKVAALKIVIIFFHAQTSLGAEDGLVENCFFYFSNAEGAQPYSLLKR